MTVASARRNAWLRLDDAALLKQCREERYRSSGPGGQRRNKVETAIRLHHEPSGVSAHSNDSRMLQENRTRALHRLRERIALDVRVSLSVPEEFEEQRARDGSLRVNEKNPAYPIVVAAVLDALAEASGSYAGAGRMLGITTSQVLRFLKRDTHVWRAAQTLRDSG